MCAHTHSQDLYTPDVTLSDVALPEEHRQLLMNTFESFDQFQKVNWLFIGKEATLL